MPDDPGVFNIREAAAFLGTHEQTVRKLARRGAIPCFKVGRDWRFRREALLRWSEEQQPGPRGCSALIIDDEEAVCWVLADLLEHAGHRVRSTTSALKGLELVAEAAPDLVLLDLKMPEMTGPEFLARLRQTHPDLPVVIITGHPDGALMAQASRYAPIMLLAKPVDVALLRRTVSTVVGQRAARAAEGS